MIVVIGIIIALQADSLHDKHRDHIFEKNILQEIRTSLHKDLERDSLILESRVHVKSRAIDQLIGNLMAGEQIADSNLMHDFQDMQLGILFSYDAGPYEALKSAGLDKISNRLLRSELVRFYEVTMPLVTSFINGDPEQLLEKQNNLVSGITEYRYVKKDTAWQVENYINFDTILNNKDFMQLLMIERDNANYYEYRLENAIAAYNRIIELIDNELNNKS